MRLVGNTLSIGSETETHKEEEAKKEGTVVE